MKNIPCCVVRDLLPVYIENLCEETTRNQIKEHLYNCEECASLEKQLRLPNQKQTYPKKTVKEFKRIKYIRYLSIIMCTLLVVIGVSVLYQNEYKNTEKTSSLLEAVENMNLKSISHKADSIKQYYVDQDYYIINQQHIAEYLVVYFGIDNKTNTRGLLILEKGLNGKYTPIDIHSASNPYSNNLYYQSVEDGVIIAFEANEDIYEMEITYRMWNDAKNKAEIHKKIESIYNRSDIYYLNSDLLQNQLNLSEDYQFIYIDQIRFFDENGIDITNQHMNQELLRAYPNVDYREVETFLETKVATMTLFGLALIYYCLKKK